ncbi:MAG: hypothetical protein KA368_06135 [Acidobacteria bacterium]|nr:hypothetical protein [Acidobacteriota bacterium]
MDCRNYKELLDSYLCQELAVETNHQILQHAEHCSSCRSEMASRRNMRESLRRACLNERMSDEACERLRSRLHDTAYKPNPSAKIKSINWRDRLAGFFSFRVLIPVSTVILFLAIGALFYFKTQTPTVAAFELSDTLMAESADDHRNCATHFLSSTKPVVMPGSVTEFDEACLELDKVASVGAAGLTLRAAHVCQPDSRRFAHLVYTRGDNLISLLVAKRDSRALKTGLVPFDTNIAGLQKANNRELSLGAYQTSKHVVLVVSDLPESENEKLSQTLARPVVEHISRLDNQTASLPDTEKRTLIANLRRRELK